MTAPLHRLAGTKLPDWFRQPGESYHDWSVRYDAEREAAAHKRLNETLAPPSDGTNIDLAVSVGTYDGNGNPKGGGW